MKTLMTEVQNCTVCQLFFDHLCRPIIAANQDARICVIGQAPGRRGQLNGIAWTDRSGETLMAGLGTSTVQFYDTQFFA